MNRLFLFLAGVPLALFGLVLAGFGTSGCQRPQQTRTGTSVETETLTDGTKKTTSPDTVTEAMLRLPLYPDSKNERMSTKTEKPGQLWLVVTHTTKDSVAQVIEFYRPKLNNPKESPESNTFGKGLSLTAQQPNKDEVKITVVRGSDNLTYVGVGVYRWTSTGQN